MHALSRMFSTNSSTLTPDAEGLPTLWALRLLVRGQLWKRLVEPPRTLDEDIMRLVNQEELIDEDISNTELITALRAELNAFEAKDPEVNGMLASNLKELAANLSLSSLDCEILCLIALHEGQKGLREVFDLASSSPGLNQMARLIAVALDRPAAVVRRALSADAPLRQSGLLQPMEDPSDPIELTEGLSDMLLFCKEAPQMLLERYSLVGQEPELTVDAFDHLHAKLDQIRRYVTVAARRGTAGVNILIYGEPGTGKTELVRALAEDIQVELHEIRYADSNDMPIYGDQRFAAYRFCQRMLAPLRNTAILFDEVEDVFGHGPGRGRKAWVNRVLEENPRPAFWLSNDISCMDQAFIRRFNITLRMPCLTDDIRMQVARRQLSGLRVSDQWLNRMAARPDLQPGHLASARKVVRHLGLRRRDRVEAELESVLNGLAEALGHPPMVEEPKPEVASCFDPALANADQDIQTLVSGIKRSGMGRICLYGPPGTGKSELARFVAASLGTALISKRASDLLDPYLGNTEKNLAAAFSEATDKGAVLLIDEADSFLYSREGASRSWEVSQVNELLVQMESYRGILVMATNHMRVVDSAALRRFDFKIRFDYLMLDQSVQFCQKKLAAVGVSADALALRRQLAGLDLAPGDFASVERRLAVLGQQLTADSLLRGLQKEWQQRREQKGRPIGFM